MALLEVKNLKIEFDTMKGRLRAVDNISFVVEKGETLGIVGESGCGKSITSLAIMDLLAENSHVEADTLTFNGLDLTKMSGSQKRKLRGGDIAMIFQDPMTSLNPSFTVGYQLMEAIRVHQGGTKEEQKKKAIEALREVGIPSPESRMDAYPHQMSGGMSQRVMIAMAIACKPKLLIADEPTTALDVTIQAQILYLLKKLQKDHGMALVLITHDIGVVAEMADRIQVMYAGQIVEAGDAVDVIHNPKHPYTEGLLASLPAAQKTKKHRARLFNIKGIVPDLVNRPTGCQMNPRCPYVFDKCKKEVPPEITVANRQVKCFTPIGEGQERRADANQNGEVDK